MALKGTYEAVKQAIEDLIAPDLGRIKAQIAALDAKVGALDVKIGAVDTKIGAVDTKIEALRTELRSLEKRLDETLNIRERLAALEAAVRAHP
jgi:peptidoglycan hydrolase CwlO-like protein